MPVDFGQVEQARGTAETAARTAGEFGTRGITLADELRKALGTRFGETGIPQATAEARAGFLQAPTQIRSDIAQQVGAGTIYSPSQQQAIQSSRLASAMVPLSAANIIQRGAYGGLEEMIGAGTRAWQSQVGQKNLEAQLAQTGYQNMLNEMLSRAAEERAGAEAGRAAEMHPLDLLMRQAQIATAQRGPAKSYTERQAEEQEQNLRDLRSDIQAGANIQELMAAYSDTFTPNDIISQYRTAGSPYGAPGESDWDLYQRYGVTMPTQATIPEPPKEPSWLQRLFGG